MSKRCKYGCGKQIVWSDEHGFWAEVDTDEKHSYKRCAELQEQNGKKAEFYDR